MTELTVYQNDQTPIEQALAIDKDGFTTAKRLYEWLELDETHYSRWIATNITENPFAEEGVDYSPLMAKSRKGIMGRPTNDYRISASFAKKLAMQQRSERGEQARIYFLMCEQALVQAAKQIRELELERAKGIAARKSLTDVIIASGENERMKGFAIPTYTDLIYKTALGKSAKELRMQYGLEKRDSIRDNLPADDLEKVAQVERLVSELISFGKGYDEIKETLSRKEAA